MWLDSIISHSPTCTWHCSWRLVLVWTWPSTTTLPLSQVLVSMSSSLPFASWWTSSTVSASYSTMMAVEPTTLLKTGLWVYSIPRFHSIMPSTSISSLIQFPGFHSCLFSVYNCMEMGLGNGYREFMSVHVSIKKIPWEINDIMYMYSSTNVH